MTTSYFNPTDSREIVGEWRIGARASIIRSEVGGPLSLGAGTRIGPDLVTGRYVNFGDHSLAQRGEIGSFCGIGSHVSVNPYNHPTNWLSNHEFQFRPDAYAWIDDYCKMRRYDRDAMEIERVSIGSDVWIGNNAVITAGVTIGTGAVIGAGAVVTRDVGPYEIVGGVPAKTIRLRFSDDIVERLLKSKWWERPLSELSGLPFENVKACLEMLGA